VWSSLQKHQDLKEKRSGRTRRRVRGLEMSKGSHMSTTEREKKPQKMKRKKSGNERRGEIDSLNTRCNLHSGQGREIAVCVYVCPGTPDHTSPSQKKGMSVVGDRPSPDVAQCCACRYWRGGSGA